MKVTKYKFPESSFLSMEKDSSLLIDSMLNNNRLKKLLYYTSEDCLSKPALTEDQSLSLINNQIRLIPKMYIDEQITNYLFISFDNFVPNATNPQFRDNTISFEIMCHLSDWGLKDFELRPYKIAGEIDSMFNNQKLTGIGTLKFLGAKQILPNNEYAGISLHYAAIHGEEDKKGMPNPADEEQFLLDFDEQYNS